MVSLDSFRTAHCASEDDEDSYDGSASEAEEDDEWLFADERKRKGKQPAKSRKKHKKPLMEEEEEDWVTSAKVEKLCEILEGVRAKDPSDKVIVFSQVYLRCKTMLMKFTGFLDVIEPALDERNFKYGRVCTSSTSLTDSMMEAYLAVNERKNWKVSAQTLQRQSVLSPSEQVHTVSISHAHPSV